MTANAEGEVAHQDDIGTQLASDNLEAVLRNIVRLTIHTTDVDKLILLYELVAIRLAKAKSCAAQTGVPSVVRFDNLVATFS